MRIFKKNLNEISLNEAYLISKHIILWIDNYIFKFQRELTKGLVCSLKVGTN
ncbi:hypothetical protein [Lagierella sp.]|uniref:hypothetical protein n=1 Tax=Lagierella sp. TaxID=2849657 RepID=UPI00260419E9|nr:hypothetical protein [Lagierella sp.]